MSRAAPPRQRRLLARPEDLHCVVFHGATVLAYALAFWLWCHPQWSGLDGPWQRAVFTLGAAPLLGWISGVDLGVNFHNHAHRPIFRRRWLNRWWARAWTPVAGWPAWFWTHLHVVVHHRQLLGDGDWTVPRRGPDGRLESSLRYQLAHWPWRTAWHFAKDLRHGRMDRRRAAVEVLWFAVFWSVPFWIDAGMALCLWVLPHWCANVITLGRGMYVQHAGCEAYPADPSHRHSNEFLSPTFNRTMFHIGYHATHHDHPGVHWADLPELHRRRTAAAAAAAPARQSG